MLPIEIVCEVAEFFSLQTCCRLSPSCFKLHKVVQKRIDAQRKRMDVKRNKLLSCIEERWNTSGDELRCFSVLASNMKIGRIASWIGGHYCWTLDAGGVASLAQAMSARGGRVTQSQIKSFLQAAVDGHQWLRRSGNVYTFYSAEIVKPFAINFLKSSRGLNSAILLHISGCLEISNASREFIMAQDICHWVSEDYFNLCFKIGESFDKFTPLPVNAQVNRNAALLLLDRLSREAETRIVSHGENIYEIFID